VPVETRSTSEPLEEIARDYGLTVKELKDLLNRVRIREG
jgi:hypothetical protein